MRKLSWRQALGWRLRRHYLDERAPAKRMLAVAGRLCGLHAQVMSSAELTLWARVDNLDRGAVARALWEDRTLVKTWAMRGTLHLLPSRELSLWHAALGTARRNVSEAVWQKHFGITLADLDRLTDAVAGALHGCLLTREALGEKVGRLTGSAELGGKVAESSWGTLLRPAAFTGRLCFGPSVGQRVQFTHPDTWLATSRHSQGSPVEQAAATEAVTRRFLTAYGPATYHDLARWWGGGGSVSTARRWIGALGEEVAEVELDGRPAWMLAADIGAACEAPPARSVRLLPGFDQYVIGASYHAGHLMPGDLRARVYRPQGWISPVLLVNGRIEGTWRHQTKGSSVAVAIEPFGHTPAWVHRAASEEAERLAAFFGASLSLVWKR